MAQDALRILTVVHQLGEPARRPGVLTSVAGEGRLQHLERLVRRPVDLAFVLLDLATLAPGFEQRRGDLIQHLRRLLSADGDTHHRRRGEHLRRFRRGSWERWDDVLVYLGCRDLLRVRPLRDAARPAATQPVAARGLSYLLTDAGAEYLEQSAYPSDPEVATYRERCQLIRDFLGRDFAAELDLEKTLQEVDHRLESYCHQEQVAAEEDLLDRYYQSTFGEAL